MGCCFLLEERHLPQTNHGNRLCVRLNFHSNNDKNWKSCRILRVRPKHVKSSKISPLFQDFQSFMFFICFFFFLFFCFSFLFSVVRADAKTRKNRKVPIDKYDDFPLCKFDFGAVEQWLGMGLVEGDLPLSFFIFSYVPSPFFFFAHFSFKFISLPASFSQRCFLHGRCSMEMWCPDDTGRESWDWVGPPTWERA